MGDWLYPRAIAEYADLGRRWLAKALPGRGRWATGGHAPRGCSLVGTAVTEVDRDPEVWAVAERDRKLPPTRPTRT